MNYDRCQGWSNHATWAVNTWFTGNPSFYAYWQEQAKICYLQAVDSLDYPTSVTQKYRAIFILADRLEATFTDLDLRYTHERRVTLYTDLLQDALSEVNYEEIACAFVSSHIATLR